MKHENIIILGGSGFVGRNLAIELTQRGYNVTIPSRRPHRLQALKVLPNIIICQANIMDQVELTALCKGHDTVINLVGILNENRKNSFRRVHVDFVKSIIHACQTHKIKRLLHMSALGASQASGSSLYLRSKGEGENLIHTLGKKDFQVTSFQPSVIFGPNDLFINRFSFLLKLCLGIFPLACPNSRLAPVYIGDVVKVMANSIDNPETYKQHYPLCGPESWTLMQIVELIKEAQQTKCKVIGLPNALAKFQAAILQNLPGKLFTLDHFRSLQTSSTCEKSSSKGQTSLSHYVKGLPHQFNRKPDYDIYRNIKST